MKDANLLLAYDGAAWRDLMAWAAIPTGTAGTPGLVFKGDPNTGLFSPTADSVAIAAGGGEVVRFLPGGLAGFGTTDPAGQGGDLVVVRTKPGSQTIAKVVNPTNAVGSQARFDLATGVPNAYALFGLTNATTSVAEFIFSGGSAVQSMNLYFDSFVFCASSGSERMRTESGGVRPGTDNSSTLGTGAFRWSSVYAATGAINTSDAREKTALVAIPDSVKRAVRRVIAQAGVFQWLAAVERKGADRARLHVGVTAQAVRDAFLAEGEDPHRWALFCEDETVDGADGSPEGASPRLGLRHDQLLFLAISCLT